MTYDSFITISSALIKALETLDSSIRRFPTELRAEKPDHGGWSFIEIIEHVAIVEEMTVRLLTSLIAKAKPRTSDSIEPICIPNVAEYTPSTRVRTAPRFEPTGAVTLDEARTRIQMTHEQFDVMLNRIGTIDPASVRFPHPTLGQLDIGQWFAFIAEHRERHSRQIDERIQRASS